jgi:hypothetical protein
MRNIHHHELGYHTLREGELDNQKKRQKIFFFLHVNEIHRLIPWEATTLAYD